MFTVEILSRIAIVLLLLFLLALTAFVIMWHCYRRLRYDHAAKKAEIEHLNSVLNNREKHISMQSKVIEAEWKRNTCKNELMEQIFMLLSPEHLAQALEVVNRIDVRRDVGAQKAVAEVKQCLNDAAETYATKTD